MSDWFSALSVSIDAPVDTQDLAATRGVAALDRTAAEGFDSG